MAIRNRLLVTFLKHTFHLCYKTLQGWLLLLLFTFKFIGMVFANIHCYLYNQQYIRYHKASLYAQQQKIWPPHFTAVWKTVRNSNFENEKESKICKQRHICHVFVTTSLRLFNCGNLQTKVPVYWYIHIRIVNLFGLNSVQLYA